MNYFDFLDKRPGLGVLLALGVVLFVHIYTDQLLDAVSMWVERICDALGSKKP